MDFETLIQMFFIISFKKEQLSVFSWDFGHNLFNSFGEADRQLQTAPSNGLAAH